MKKMIVLFLAGVVMAWTAQAGAFDLAVGVRYFSGSYLGLTYRDEMRLLSSQSGIIQVEALIGPIQFAMGNAIVGTGNAWPVTIGYIFKFPTPVIKPYLGVDLSFLLDVDASTYPGYSIIFTVQPKGGVEVYLGSISVYCGVGYSLVSYNGFVPVGLNWELGARYYLLK